MVLATELDFSATLSGSAYEDTAFTYSKGDFQVVWKNSLRDWAWSSHRLNSPISLTPTSAKDIPAARVRVGSGVSSVGKSKICEHVEGDRQPQGVRDFYLGYASMTIWLDADSPWAARQTVDVAISSSEASQSSCSAWQRGVDAVLPEGGEVHHTLNAPPSLAASKPLSSAKLTIIDRKPTT